MSGSLKLFAGHSNIEGYDLILFRHGEYGREGFNLGEVLFFGAQEDQDRGMVLTVGWDMDNTKVDMYATSHHYASRANEIALLCEDLGEEAGLKRLKEYPPSEKPDCIVIELKQQFSDKAAKVFQKKLRQLVFEWIREKEIMNFNVEYTYRNKFSFVVASDHEWGCPGLESPTSVPVYFMEESGFREEEAGEGLEPRPGWAVLTARHEEARKDIANSEKALGEVRMEFFEMRQGVRKHLARFEKRLSDLDVGDVKKTVQALYNLWNHGDRDLGAKLENLHGRWMTLAGHDGSVLQGSDELKSVDLAEAIRRAVGEPCALPGFSLDDLPDPGRNDFNDLESDFERMRDEFSGMDVIREGEREFHRKWLEADMLGERVAFMREDLKYLVDATAGVENAVADMEALKGRCFDFKASLDRFSRSSGMDGFDQFEAVLSEVSSARAGMAGTDDPWAAWLGRVERLMHGLKTEFADKSAWDKAEELLAMVAGLGDRVEKCSGMYEFTKTMRKGR